MFDCRRYIFANAPSQLFWEREFRQAQGRNRKSKWILNTCNLKLCNLNICILVIVGYHIFVFVLRVHISNFRGHNTLPLHGKTQSAIDEQTETGPKRLHLQLTQMWGGGKWIRGKKWKPQIQSMLTIVFTGVCGMIQRYGRTLHILMCSVIPSRNDIVKLPLTWMRSMV